MRVRVGTTRAREGKATHRGELVQEIDQCSCKRCKGWLVRDVRRELAEQLRERADILVGLFEAGWPREQQLLAHAEQVRWMQRSDTFIIHGWIQHGTPWRGGVGESWLCARVFRRRGLQQVKLML